MKKRFATYWCLFASIVLSLILSACGAKTPSSDVTGSLEEAAPSVAVEEAVRPTPAEEETEFYTASGISYSAKLGEPILGEDAVALAVAGDVVAAAEQITNVGDAIHYMKAALTSSGRHDACQLFADLLMGDYDEIGLVHLSHSGNGYSLVYIQQDGVFYSFDPTDMASMSYFWPSAPRSDTDLDALCEKLVDTCPDNLTGAPMTSYTITPFDFIELRKEFLQRKYQDETLQKWVDSNIPFDQACRELSTISDAVRYMQLRGYKFAPDDAGTEASRRYNLNNGACAGTSALFNALLEGDYDDQGYVYIFYARGEHFIDYFVKDGVYFFCDFLTPFNSGGSPVCHITTDPKTFYEAWLNIEPHDLNDPDSDMYLATIFTTGYYGGLARIQSWLRESPDGKYSKLILSDEEKASQNILFMRDGYTFDF